MNKSVWLLGCATILLAACDEFILGNSNPSDQFIRELPANVLAIAAPYQDLTAVKLDPTSGCYIYRYVGPVETTFLPLRSTKDRPICVVRADEALTG